MMFWISAEIFGKLSERMRWGHFPGFTHDTIWNMYDIVC